jgi:hypothetical protein
LSSAWLIFNVGRKKNTMSDITHFCDLNSPAEFKEAIVDHLKLRELCSKTGIKRLRQYLAYINPDRKVEIAIISSEIEEKIEIRVSRRSAIALTISFLAVVVSIASASAAWISYLSARASRADSVPAQLPASEKKAPNQTLVPTPMSVTPAANAPVAPATGAAHL